MSPCCRSAPMDLPKFGKECLAWQIPHDVGISDSTILKGPDGALEGIVVSHVDDLLMAGSDLAGSGVGRRAWFWVT